MTKPFVPIAILCPEDTPIYIVLDIVLDCGYCNM